MHNSRIPNDARSATNRSGTNCAHTARQAVHHWQHAAVCRHQARPRPARKCYRVSGTQHKTGFRGHTTKPGFGDTRRFRGHTTKPGFGDTRVRHCRSRPEPRRHAPYCSNASSLVQSQIPKANPGSASRGRSSDFVGCLFGRPETRLLGILYRWDASRFAETAAPSPWLPALARRLR